MVNSLRHRVSKPISRMAKNGTLGLEEVRAVLGIEEAVLSILTDDIRSGGISERGFSQGRRGSNFEEGFLRRHDIRQNYYNWIENMKAMQLPAGPVLDIVIEGLPLTKVDRAWKKRKGWAQATLISGLRLYIKMETEALQHRKRLTA